MKAFFGFIGKLLLMIIALFINAAELVILACCWIGYKVANLLYRLFTRIYEIVKDLLSRFNPSTIGK